MRLRIGKAGKYLQLQRGSSIQIEMQTPVYFGDRDASVLPGTKSYSFTVPYTDSNRLLLRRPDLLDNPEPFLRELGWQIYFDGWLLFQGRLEVEDTKEGEDFRVTFIGGLAGNFELLKTTYLTDLPLPDVDAGDDEDGVLSYAQQVTELADDYSYVFPTVKVGERGNEKYEYINYYTSGQYVRNVSILGENIRSTLVPMLRLKYVLEQAFALAGYSLSGVLSAGPHASELQQLLLWNNRTLDQLTGIPTNEEVSFDDLSLQNTIRLARHLPVVKCNDLVRAICNTFNWAPFINFSSRQVELKAMVDILNNSTYTDFTSRCHPQYIRGKRLEDLPASFQYQHTSSDQYAEDQAPTFRPLPVGKVFQTVQDLQDNITVDDANTIVYIESLNEYFEFLGFRPPNSTPVLVRKGQDLGTVNERQEPVFEIGADTFLMFTSSKQANGSQTFLFSGRQYLPAAYVDLVSPWYEGEQTEDVHLLFYRGLQQDADKEYPLASSTSYNHAEERIGNLSLLLTGEDGLYSTWWKQWHEALQRMRPVTYATRLTAPDIANLDFSRKYRIDKHLYFIRRVQVTISTDDIMPATVEYMQIL